MPRTYSVIDTTAFSSTTAATATAALTGSVTVNGITAASATTGRMHTPFCSAAVARKSTPEQNFCWYTPPAATLNSETRISRTAGSTPPTAISRLAHDASTATTPSTSATTRVLVRASPRNIAASTAVTTGFMEMMTAPSTAGAPCVSATYRHVNSSPCASSPLTSTCTSVRPVGQLTR